MLTLRQRVELTKRNNATARSFGLANPAGRLWDDQLELASASRAHESGGYYAPSATFESWLSIDCDKIPINELKDHLAHMESCVLWCCRTCGGIPPASRQG